jgi:putative nucleotidyltransferase with HDIG domain
MTGEVVPLAERSPWARARHRVRQFARAATARVPEHERRAAQDLLGAGLYRLFAAMRRNDQRHALDVLTTLRHLGEQDLVVLRAALLHDAGKAGAPFTIVERSASVFLAAAVPAVLARITQTGWGARYQRYRDHARRGAELVREGGGDALLAQVIAEHHEPAGTLPQTQRLRFADRLN